MWKEWWLASSFPFSFSLFPLSFLTLSSPSPTSLRCLSHLFCVCVCVCVSLPFLPPNPHPTPRLSKHNRVAEWEKLHCDKCPDPKLLRFLGKPDDLTPKAWFKHRVLGGPAPFDRHDWTIDRCGEEVRYVIDYYYDGEKADGDELPGLHSAGAVRSITVDARPALDSFTAVSDRARLWISGREPAALAKAEQELAAAASRKAAQGEELASRDRDAASAVERMGRGEEQMDVPRVFAFVQGRCGQVFEELRAATAALEESAGKEGKGDGNVLETLAQKQQMATIKLRTCVGRLVGCRGEADAMVEDPCEGNMERLEACMTAFEARANAASKGV